MEIKIEILLFGDFFEVLKWESERGAHVSGSFNGCQLKLACQRINNDQTLPSQVLRGCPDPPQLCCVCPHVVIPHPNGLEVAWAWWARPNTRVLFDSLDHRLWNLLKYCLLLARSDLGFSNGIFKNRKTQFQLGDSKIFKVVAHMGGISHTSVAKRLIDNLLGGLLG